MKTRLVRIFAVVLVLALGLAGCGGATVSESTVVDASSSVQQPVSDSADASEPVTIMVAAAASLEYSYTEEIIPLFQQKHPHITVEGSYDSSGKLQTQIEEGLEADVFMSAATKQMNALDEQGLIEPGSVVPLLENRIVLIAPANSDLDINSFEDILKADTIAIGDPESVPAGQYAREALTNLGIYGEVAKKASFGTNVTEVLNWVAEGSADVGIVYATDAATTDAVTILAEAPEGSLAEKVIYPVGIIAASANKEAARLFVDFLGSEEALAIFSAYGFTPNK